MKRLHVEALKGTEALKSGSFQKAFAAFTEKFRPEAAYFLPDEGMRSGFLVFDMQHSQQLPEVAEPFFALGYTVDVTPCMTLEELQAGRRAAGGQ